MASKIFSDADFFLDLTLNRTGFAAASAIMQQAIEGDLWLYTTPAVLHITGYFTRKAYNSKQAKQIVSTLLNDVQVIDCNHATATIAVNSNIEDIEDAFQYYTALAHGMDYFISSDKGLKKLAISQLPVLTANELLAELRLGLPGN